MYLENNFFKYKVSILQNNSANLITLVFQNSILKFENNFNYII